MSNKVKEMDIINQTYYFFDDIINIKNFDLNNIRIDEKSYKRHCYLLHQICDDQNSKYVKINSAISLYLIFNKVNGYFEKINGNKYLMLVPTNENKAKMKKNMKNYGLKSEI